jgi:membrane-associated phospholipid phosphatase
MARGTRKRAGFASDGIFGAMAGMLVFDWWWLRGEYGALRSAQVDTRYLFANNVATRIAKLSAARQRPYVEPCGRDDAYVSSCDSGRDKNAGFWSGHASNTATIAGLLCARHLARRERDLFDGFVCGAAAAGALTGGILRIVSEHHFATDVIAGWAAGAIFGYLLPRALDYRGASGGPLALSAFAPVIGREYYGFRFGFRF